MANFPLLLLSTPQISTRSSKPRAIDKYHYPEHGAQVKRLTPQFDQVINSIDTLQAIPGTEPELVLVIETIGYVADFIKAVKEIDGLDWLGELEEHDIEPSFDFYDNTSKEKLLKGRLYLVMTNKTAMQKILSLWKQWENNKNTKLDQGLNKFKDIFKHLSSIKQWGVKDRLIETGILDDWSIDLQHGESPNKCEIELWFKDTIEKRQQSQKNVEFYISQCGGKVLASSIIEEIAYHALLVELPPEIIKQIIQDNDKVALVKCNNIMFFRSPGQTMPLEGDIREGISTKIEIKALPKGNPIVALLDGYPMSNHETLKGRLQIDDPDNLESNYPIKDRKHGTAMASLIANGDLSVDSQPLRTPLYVYPVMRTEHGCENLPNKTLFVDFIHKALRQIFEGSDKNPPHAPQIKIINFSIGDKNRPFIGEISPLAKILDWAANKYNVLFIISAGNYVDELDLKINVEGLNKDERQKLIIQTLFANALHRRIISPAESINSLTIGAAHCDDSQHTETSYLFDPFDSSLPSPISPFGSGFRRSIKPEIIFAGGRPLYQRSLESPGTKILHRSNYSPPGNLVANPSSNSGDPSFKIYTRGTSNAAALTTRTAHQCYDILNNIIKSNDLSIVPLLKAMLVHGSNWGAAYEIIQNALEDQNLDKTKLKEAVAKWLGYGTPDFKRVFNCTAQRATLLGYSSISAGEAHYFDIPIPSSLEAKVLKRRLIVTLAWLSSITPLNQKYRDTQLWFEVEGKNYFSDTMGADHHAVRRGTVQHEILEDSKVITDVSDKILRVKINCTSDAKPIEKAVSYGLFVTLEIAEGLEIPIYEEIRTLLATRVRIKL